MRLSQLRARYKQDKERASVLLKANYRRRLEIIAACPFQSGDDYPGPDGLDLVLRVRFGHAIRYMGGPRRDCWLVDTLDHTTYTLPIPEGL